MRHLHKTLTLAIFAITILVTPVLGQTAAQERAAKLRQQLADLQMQQTEIQTRLQQVEEDLKPENIEKGLAGIGSTRPEDLREKRRRQLEVERKSLQTRLDQFATSRARLETGIAQADADVYQRSAGGPIVGTQQTSATQPSTSAQPSSINPPTIRRRARRPNKKPRRIRRPPQDQHHAS
ncbi:MAG: hypothetical protein ACR2G5_17275 [Pyrinomonadaceae bacterium]